VSSQRGSDDAASEVFLGVVAGLGTLIFTSGLMMWLSGQLSGLVWGNGWPSSELADIIPLIGRVATNPGDLHGAWPPGARAALGPIWLILLFFALFFALLIWAAVYVVRRALNRRRRRESRTFRLGFASGDEIRKLLGAGAVLRKGKSVRPSTAGRRDVRPEDVGFYVGRDVRSRQQIYGSIEDVFVILAPPRQGKDVHFCTPFTIDAPGACIVTSTRLDAFTNTYLPRSKVGKVFVFDPNGMTAWPEVLRWSPIRGCEHPAGATGRARALVLGSGLSLNSEGSFFVIGAITILRCFLHAAALGGKSLLDITRWTAEQDSPEPIEILRAAEAEGRGAPGWADVLEGQTVKAKPATRADTFANLSVAFNCFADPTVLASCAPAPDEMFDVKEFLSGRNTLYVLGREDGGVAPLVTAIVDDLLEVTRNLASRMPNSRLDPPLTVELNEVAHIAPLPNLPAYMGDSGGFSIALHVYLQSLSQARARWGDHEAMIMWDNAALRIIMGGAGNINDLEDVSRLMGQYREKQRTITSGGPHQTVSTGETMRPVLSPEEIRTLEFGTAVVVARASRPVEVQLTPWWKRKDGDEIAAGKKTTETNVNRYLDERDHGPSRQRSIDVRSIDEWIE
jgi:type IV secretory pathway TraG/TraD family ATPase VirD4